MSKRDHADFWTLPEVLAWAKKRDPPDAFRDSLLTLHELCNAGHVKALGHPDDRRSGAPLPILASDWVGLYFDNDGKKLRSADLLDGGRIAWTSVRFSEADLVREWPKSGAAAFVAEQADRYWADRF